MKDRLLEKTPPHNIETEQAVLSALFIDNTGFDDIESLTSDDFYHAAHREIFNSMLTLKSRNQPVDLVTVAQYLSSRDMLKQVGGAEYLSLIADTAPVAVNVSQYAETVKNLAAVRRMLFTAIKIVDRAYSVTDVDEYISKSQADVLQVQTTTSIDKIYGTEILMQQALDRIEAARSQAFDAGLKFGFPTLDNFMQIFGSKLIILAGRPGMGKTALALSISRFLAEQGIKVGFLSIEMDKESLADRLLGHAANVNPLLFYARDGVSQSTMAEIKESADHLSQLPLFVDDADCKIQDVERKCRKLKKMGCQIIFIDQLSKIRGEPKQSKFEQYSDNCSSIALLKKELRVPIVLLCQLNRNVEQRQGKKPEMVDLKQTGMIEEDADMVLLLYRPGYYVKETDDSITEIILAKNRQGAKGVEQGVLFNAKRMMFELVQSGKQENCYM